jgi:hypothetical protein
MNKPIKPFSLAASVNKAYDDLFDDAIIPVGKQAAGDNQTADDDVPPMLYTLSIPGTCSWPLNAGRVLFVNGIAVVRGSKLQAELDAFITASGHVGATKTRFDHTNPRHDPFAGRTQAGNAHLRKGILTAMGNGGIETQGGHNNIAQGSDLEQALLSGADGSLGVDQTALLQQVESRKTLANKIANIQKQNAVPGIEQAGISTNTEA